jgi:hypothetical protein
MQEVEENFEYLWISEVGGHCKHVAFNTHPLSPGQNRSVNSLINATVKSRGIAHGR